MHSFLTKFQNQYKHLIHQYGISNRIIVSYLSCLSTALCSLIHTLSLNSQVSLQKIFLVRL